MIPVQVFPFLIPFLIIGDCLMAKGAFGFAGFFLLDNGLIVPQVPHLPVQNIIRYTISVFHKI